MEHVKYTIMEHVMYTACHQRHVPGDVRGGGLNGIAGNTSRGRCFLCSCGEGIKHVLVRWLGVWKSKKEVFKGKVAKCE
jgi:hypothetical protein